ncbi:spermidine putrescine ABC superfamily ATP binding cassette transporter substrate-binding protein [Companilactobacillus tucceti DSM 20183]|uniref:Spermidine putrescine ABC superfamily ATP binding cassette transporter substrate-binding protein n=1 Tax=Companilactobacillus tucceti DSM 20183 TaxID=1423811 RepID=A0A0R1JAB1_9LACO|nr:ABC transporter substrate-binding protein [Companilactobacillus tucceti]KRK64119.1 spermidine putrescine ABC superfamily ATP binding cassette transporter substrate-binding protein [Companilactobacillus tucceti DSM 20183]
MKKNTKFFAIITTLLVTLLVAGCSNNSSSKESKQLTVSTFGLATKQMTNDVFKPFQKENKLKVKSQFGDSSSRFTQIEHNPNSSVDVIELAQNNAVAGQKKGLFKKLDFDKIKNFKYLSKEQQKLAKDTNSVPYTVNSIGIIYNPKTVGKITSWDQLWDKKLENRIAIPDISTTFGPAMVYVASEHAKTDVTKDDGKAAFGALKELKPNVVKTYSKSSDLANMFKSGEIDAAVVGDFAVDMIQGAAPDVDYVVPESGTYANYDTVSILKNSKNTEAAYKYIDYRIGKDSQTVVAGSDSLNNAPVNSQVSLTRDVKHMTFGDVAKRAKLIDFNYVNKELPTWIKTWNQTMN